MLLNIKTGWKDLQKRSMNDIVIFVSSLNKLRELNVPFVFSDRHAYLRTVNFSSNLEDLKNIDWTILQNRDFKRDPNDPEKMDRYMAEALVFGHVPIEALIGVLCFSEERKIQLDALCRECGVTLNVAVKPGWYF
ncbi:hypothetical protein BH10ACI4_BH10ACI4_26550 [soil metagenome]